MESPLRRQRARGVSPAPLPLRARAWLSRFCLLALCALIVVVFVTPYEWMVASALRSQGETFQYAYPLQWRTFVPANPSLAGFIDLFGQFNFARVIFNTGLVAVAVVGLGMITNSLAGFAFARMPLPRRELLLLATLATAFMPFEAMVIPLYFVVKALGLTDTYAALIVPWIMNPFGIFLMRQAFAEVPRELEDAAAIDGASWLRTFWTVMLPQVRPALISFAIIQFLWSWESFFWPLVVTHDPSLKVIQVAISSFATEHNTTRWDLTFAASALATLPIVVAFLAAQRYFVRGIVTTGLR
jgi:ABC-type glycerol-3-phosphate transport system permease component